MASTAKDGSGRFGDMRDYMAKTLFQPHRARDAIWDAHQGKIPTLLRYYAGLASVPITRWLAPMGFDYVWIDWEHSAMNIETMTTVRWKHFNSHTSLARATSFVICPLFLQLYRKFVR